MSSTSPQRLRGIASVNTLSKSLSSKSARVREVFAYVGQMPFTLILSRPYSIARHRVRFAAAPFDML